MTDPQQQALPPQDDGRNDFEAFCTKRWAGDRGGLVRKSDGTYDLSPVEFAWQAFTAARALAASAPLQQASVDLAVAQALTASREPLKPMPEESPSMPELWSVDIYVNGDSVLSIGDNWLSSVNDLDDEIVIGAAKHMLSFIGYGLPDGGFTPPDNEASAPSREVPDHVADVSKMVPPGWKLVPIEPTARMLAAHWDEALDVCLLDHFANAARANAILAKAYAAMLAAAPSPPSVAAEETKP